MPKPDRVEPKPPTEPTKVSAVVATAIPDPAPPTPTEKVASPSNSIPTVIPHHSAVSESVATTDTIASAPVITEPAASAIVSARPRYRNNPKPGYPVAARRLRQQGTVLLSVAVNQSGKPTLVSVKESSGSRVLDDAAVNAVRAWDFEPARSDGRPVASRVEIPLRFELPR
jgi:protein TonB